MNCTTSKRRRHRAYPTTTSRLFSDLLNTAIGEVAQPQPKASIPTNVMEFDDRYELMLSVPSRDRTDVEISIEEDVLSIKVAAVEKDANYRLREWTTNETTKRFKLSANVDKNAVKATVHSGVLTITLPKTLIDSIKTKREIEIH